MKYKKALGVIIIVLVIHFLVRQFAPWRQLQDFDSSRYDSCLTQSAAETEEHLKSVPKEVADRMSKQLNNETARRNQCLVDATLNSIYWRDKSQNCMREQDDKAVQANCLIGVANSVKAQLVAEGKLPENFEVLPH